ncbi:MAG: DUF4349 domain-containing protein [Acidimicrobiales bacterium]
MDDTALLDRPPQQPNAAPPTSKPRRRRSVVLVIAMLVVVAGLIGSRTGSRGAHSVATTSKASAVDRVASGPSTVPGGATPELQPDAGSTTGADVGAPVAQPGTAPGSTGAAPSPGADLTKIVKTGSVELGVGKGASSGTLDTITNTAAALGGYVSATQSSGSETGSQRPSAALTVRVPAAQFEQLLSKVRTLGEVRSVTTTGQDVTAQYTDLGARIGALTATRDQLLTILHGATQIQDVLAVQDRITGVQSDLDSLVGQQKVLGDQAEQATLSVNVLEPGAEVAPTPGYRGDDLGDAWQEAKDHFTDGAKAVVAGSGVVALALVALAAAFAIVRIARRRSVLAD